jgi:hypothetical protein
MYAFLWILGAVIAAAGIVLIAAGAAPIEGHAFDASVITPGAVAIVGGLILIGLGLAVRVLNRIEQTLAARPVRPARPDAAGVVPAERPAMPQRIPFPPKPTPLSDPQAAPPAAAVAPEPAPAEDTALQRPPETVATLVRVDNAVVEAADVVPLSKPPARADEDIREVDQANIAKQAVGASPVRGVTRLDRTVRPVSRPDRSKNFDAFWPKRQPSGPGTQPATEQPAAPEPPVAQVEAGAAQPSAAPAVAAEAPTPVSILKSGVVDGMAYTLYSDGSIEAQLPQGTLRFGSITELRSHIEKSA